MLEQEGWRQSRPLHEFLFDNAWGEAPNTAKTESHHDSER